MAVSYLQGSSSKSEPAACAALRHMSRQAWLLFILCTRLRLMYFWLPAKGEGLTWL